MRRLLPFGLTLGAALLAALSTARADVRVPALFSDNMVLQRDARVPVWGWAEEGEAVTVSFRGEEVRVIAEDGRWKAWLSPGAAGGPFELAVAGNNRIVINNVLVGENWLCGGQSNMAMALNRTAGAEEAVASANHPEMRLFVVKIAAADAPRDDVEGAWVVCTPETAADFSAVGYYFGRDLQRHLKVPVGLIQACVGGTNASCWTPHAVLAETPGLESFLAEYEAAVAAYPEAKLRYESALAAHEAQRAQAAADGITLTPAQRRAPRAPMGPEHLKRPSALYNAMIAPLQPYGVRGAIWYQGEANARTPESAAQYHTLFPALINAWRAGWEQERFPFLYVQLAAYGDNPAWPLLRDAQTEALAVGHAGMAVTIDVGDRDDVHPKDKATVGARLVQAARDAAYSEDVVASGPQFIELEIRDNLALVYFRNAQNGLKSSAKPLTGFWIAGADGVFVPASAAIAGPNVIVQSESVPKPVAVRYGWQAYPDPPCTLYNREGLPAVPFRSDEFPIGE